MAEAPTTDPSGRTPYQWFDFLVRKLMGEQRWLREDLDYVSGNHPLPDPDKRYAKALKNFREQSRTNFYGMLTQAPLDRMNVLGLRVGSEGKADEDAKMMWMDSSFDFQFQHVKKLAATHGRAYILVSPPPEGKKWPKLTYEDPRIAITEQDPLNPTKSIAGLRLWVDPVDGMTYAVLYLADTIHYFKGKGVDVISMLERMRELRAPGDISEAATFTIGPVLPNPLGECPLVMIPWSPDSKSQCGDLKDVQDRINTTMLMRMTITQNQAFRQRWMTGAKPLKGKNKTKGGPMFDPAADVLWVTDNSDAEFGDFAQADIRQISEAIDGDATYMAGLVFTPPQYMLQKVSNVSGETLTAAEAGFISMIKTRMACLGWGIEQALKLGFKYLGDTEKAEEVDCEVIWASPEVHTMAEIADSSVKVSQTLMTAPPYVLRLLMPQMGYKPDEVEFAATEAEKYQAEQQKREDDALQQQMDHQEKLGAMGAAQKPGAQSTAKNKAATAAKKPAPGAQKAKSPGGK